MAHLHPIPTISWATPTINPEMVTTILATIVGWTYLVLVMNQGSLPDCVIYLMPVVNALILRAFTNHRMIRDVISPGTVPMAEPNTHEDGSVTTKPPLNYLITTDDVQIPRDQADICLEFSASNSSHEGDIQGQQATTRLTEVEINSSKCWGTVDCGSSKTLVSQTMASRLGLPCRSIEPPTIIGPDSTVVGRPELETGTASTIQDRRPIR